MRRIGLGGAGTGAVGAGRPKRPWWRRKRVLIPVGLLALIVVMSLMNPQPQQTAAPGQPSTQEATTPASQPPQAAAPQPTQEPQTVEATLRDKFGDRLMAVDTEGANTTVKFKIADNISAGTIRTGAQNDTLEVLRAAQQSAGGDSVTVSGEFPMKDQYGNTADKQILLVNYSADMLRQLNLGDDGMLADRVWDVADTSPRFVHPELQGQ